jgi:hypothetical protein
MLPHPSDEAPEMSRMGRRRRHSLLNSRRLIRGAARLGRALPLFGSLAVAGGSPVSWSCPPRPSRQRRRTSRSAPAAWTIRPASPSGLTAPGRRRTAPIRSSIWLRVSWAWTPLPITTASLRRVSWAVSRTAVRPLIPSQPRQFEHVGSPPETRPDGTQGKIEIYVVRDPYPNSVYAFHIDQDGLIANVGAN